MTKYSGSRENGCQERSVSCLELQSCEPGRAVKSKRCQGQTRSRESGIIRKGCQQKEMKRWKRRSDKQQAPEGVVRKNSCQEKRKRSKRWRSQRLWQPGGQLRSYRLSLFFIDFRGFPPRNFCLPAQAQLAFCLPSRTHTHILCFTFARTATLRIPYRRTWEEKLQKIHENTAYTAYTQRFLLSDSIFFRVWGFRVLGLRGRRLANTKTLAMRSFLSMSKDHMWTPF